MSPTAASRTSCRTGIRRRVITPKAFVAGTTVDKAMNGTGPFKLTKYDAATGASYVRNDDWWGGKPILDGVELDLLRRPGDADPRACSAARSTPSSSSRSSAAKQCSLLPTSSSSTASGRQPPPDLDERSRR